MSRYVLLCVALLILSAVSVLGLATPEPCAGRCIDNNVDAQAWAVDAGTGVEIWFQILDPYEQQDVLKTVGFIKDNGTISKYVLRTTDRSLTEETNYAGTGHYLKYGGFKYIPSDNAYHYATPDKNWLKQQGFTHIYLSLTREPIEGEDDPVTVTWKIPFDDIQGMPSSLFVGESYADQTFCSDTDTHNRHYYPGTVAVVQGYDAEVYVDQCTGVDPSDHSPYGIEFACSNPPQSAERFKCRIYERINDDGQGEYVSERCENGRCVDDVVCTWYPTPGCTQKPLSPCQDSDGLNQFAPGQVTLHGDTFVDTCENDVVTEHYCLGDEHKVQEIDCYAGCFPNVAACRR